MTFVASFAGPPGHDSAGLYAYLSQFTREGLKSWFCVLRAPPILVGPEHLADGQRPWPDLLIDIPVVHFFSPLAAASAEHVLFPVVLFHVVSWIDAEKALPGIHEIFV